MTMKPEQNYIEEMLSQNPDTIFSSTEIGEACERTFQKKFSPQLVCDMMRELVLVGVIKKIAHGKYQSA